MKRLDRRDALLVAVRRGDMDRIKGLLRERDYREATVRGPRDLPLLAYVCTIPHEGGVGARVRGRICRALIRAGVGVNAVGWCGDTPLLHAVFRGDAVLVRLLLDAGASTVQPEPGEFPPVPPCRPRDEWDMNALGGCRPPPEPAAEAALPLVEACARGHVAVAQLLLARGADANAHYCSGVTALQAALFWHQLGAVRLLLRHGADVRIGCCCPCHRRPWHGSPALRHGKTWRESEEAVNTEGRGERVGGSASGPR